MTEMLTRLLNTMLPEGQSAFLWGPGKTGKTTHLSAAFSGSLRYELTNYANIARDCGADAKTVKEYYQILVDTLLGTMIEPYKRRKNRDVIIKAGKFYLFDVGIAGANTHRRKPKDKGEQFGKALEHFILVELLAHLVYRELYYNVNFWGPNQELK